MATRPQYWMNLRTTNTLVAQLAAAVAPARDPAPATVNLDEPPENAEHRMPEVATFPSPSSVASKPQAPKPAEAPKPQRVVITPDAIIAAMQGKLQQAAEKAVQEAVTKHVDDAVREALSSIDDVRNSSVREIEELFPTRAEALRLSSKAESSAAIASQWKEEMEKYRGQAEEMAQRLEKQAAELRRELAKSQEFVERMTREMEPQINARLSEAVARATSEFEGATARTAHRRYELMLENTQALTQEALMKIDARSAEVQALVQSAVNSALAAFQRQTDLHVNAVLSETQERALSALPSLDAESRAAVEARRVAMETEVARAAERSTDQFRRGMKAFLYSCLVAAVSAVDEHSKSTLDGLVKDNGKTAFEADKESSTQEDAGIIPIRTSTPSLTKTKRRYSASVTLGQSDSQSPQKKKPTVLSGRLAFPLYSCHRTDVIPEGGRLTVLCVLWLCQKVVKLNGLARTSVAGTACAPPLPSHQCAGAWPP